jgi:hypothetical protein
VSREIDDRLAELIDRLRDDLNETLGADGRAKLTLYRAATELMIDGLQPRDAGDLGLASSHLALRALGVTDAGVERLKATLRARGPEPETLNRRQ